MKKHVLAIAALILLPCTAQADECPKGALVIENTPVQTLAPEDAYTAHITGTIDAPTPGYSASITAGGGDEQTPGMLVLKKKDPESVDAQVVTPVRIDATIKIPHISRKLIIDVIKPFDWGPDYYEVDYPDEFANHKTLCMTPEQYK